MLFFRLIIVMLIATACADTESEKCEHFFAMSKANYKKAVQHCLAAAEQGNTLSQYRLGLLYRWVDKEKAEEWLKMAAEKEHLDAQINLGLMLQDEPKGYEKAVFWLTKLAKNGNADGQWYLAEMYSEGKGVPKSDKDAMYWYTKSAEQGGKNQAYFGLLLSAGVAVPKNDKLAVYWFTKGAEEGDSLAQSMLARKYFDGEGAVQDFKKVIFWLTKAAEAGDGSAQMHLGKMYREGQIIETNKVVAYAWYSNAAAQGEKEAVIARDSLEKELNPSQKEESQELSKKYYLKYRK